MFSIGSDPEFMLVAQQQTRTVYKSAIDILPRQKRAICKRGHLFYYENVMAECGMKPAKTRAEFARNVRDCLRILAETVRPLKVVLKSAYHYQSDELEHPDALEAACEDELCAYDLQSKKAPKEIIRTTDFRTAGGHIHLGSDLFEDADNAPAVVRMLDLFLTIPFVLIDRDETAKERREVYGQAGRHRLTDYGIEYRTPSNYWLGSPDTTNLVFDLCKFVLKFVEKGGHERFWTAHTCYGYDADALRDCIDNSDIRTAKKFMMILDSNLPTKLQQNIEDAISKKGRVDPYRAWEL
jgi:hypothetical protein